MESPTPDLLPKTPPAPLYQSLEHILQTLYTAPHSQLNLMSLSRYYTSYSCPLPDRSTT